MKGFVPFGRIVQGERVARKGLTGAVFGRKSREWGKSGTEGMVEDHGG
jgi:hypothetical protein